MSSSLTDHGLPVPSRRLVLVLASGSPLWLAQLWSDRGWILAVLFNLFVLGLALGEFLRLPGRREISIKRNLPPRFFLEASDKIQLTIVNGSSRTLAVRITESLPAGLTLETPIAAGLVPPGETAAVPVAVRAVQRGDFQFHDLFVRVQASLGLVSKELRFPEHDRVKVYPRLPGAAEYQLLARIDERANPSRPPRQLRGAGMEWESLREYEPGEDLRNVDWKATAHRGSLVSRNRAVEKGQQVAILIDSGRLMANRIGSRPRLEYAIDAAVLLGYACAKRGDAVSLAAFSNRIESYLPVTKGQAALPRLLEAVYRVQGREVESDYWEVVAQVISRLKKRTLAVMLTDVLDPWGSSGLARNLMRASNRHLVLCVVMSEPRLQRMAESIPASTEEVYQKAAACQLRLDRELALETMRANGILVLETEPSRLSVQLVRRYLEIRRGGLQ